MILLLLACIESPDDTGSPSETGDTSDTSDTGDTGGAPLLADSFESTLTTTGGCSDTWLQAWDDATLTGMELYVSGPLAHAITTGEAYDAALVPGVDEVLLFVEIADPVSVNYCTDALSKRLVLNRYDAVSGLVTLHVEPPPSEYAPGVATWELQDVTFADDAGHEVLVPSFIAADVPVVQNWGG